MQEVGGRSDPQNGQGITKEESCHFPFWYNGRLRYECVELEGSSTSSRVFNHCLNIKQFINSIILLLDKILRNYFIISN